ncbi:MAG: TIGR01777 family oxidoreductase [Bacteroidota bacterium]
MATFLITGGTGMVGAALTQRLIGSGNTVIILTRRARESANPLVRYACWDPFHDQIDASAIQEADYIIHLAGANVAEKRWTSKRKQEILDSRVRSGQLLAESLRKIPNRVKAVLGASAQGWYGADPVIPNPTPFVETDPAQLDFLGSTCQAWEQSLQPVTTLGIRLIQFRIGIVLSTAGGALAEFVKPVRFGISPILGTGKQVISWIHLDDLTHLIEWSLLHESIEGIYNASAPKPVSNRFLIQSISRAYGRPFIPIPVPAFLLKLILGEMSIEVLKSTTMSAEKILQAGFSFQFGEVDQALDDLLKK